MSREQLRAPRAGDLQPIDLLVKFDDDAGPWEPYAPTAADWVLLGWAGLTLAFIVAFFA